MSKTLHFNDFPFHSPLQVAREEVSILRDSLGEVQLQQQASSGTAGDHDPSSRLDRLRVKAASARQRLVKAEKSDQRLRTKAYDAKLRYYRKYSNKPPSCC